MDTPFLVDRRQHRVNDWIGGPDEVCKITKTIHYLYVVYCLHCKQYERDNYDKIHM